MEGTGRTVDIVLLFFLVVVVEVVVAMDVDVAVDADGGGSDNGGGIGGCDGHVVSVVLISPTCGTALALSLEYVHDHPR